MVTEAQATWVGTGLRVVGEASSGPAIVIDYAMKEGEKQAGPTPMELLLIGLCSCTAMSIALILQKRRQPLTGLQVKARAEQAEEYPKVYTEIHLECIVKGRGMEPQAVERAIELSETKYCSVAAMLGKVVRITTSYRLEEE